LFIVKESFTSFNQVKIEERKYMFRFFKLKKPVVMASSLRNINSGITSHAAYEIKRDIIIFALQDTLRSSGIPLDWIDCEVIDTSDNDGKRKTCIILVMKSWNENLLKQGLLIQKKILNQIDWIDPSLDYTKFDFSWRYGIECQSPYPELPPPPFWTMNDKRQSQESNKTSFNSDMQKGYELPIVFIYDDDQLQIENAKFSQTTN
jgi:hypothetical protein